MLLFYGGDVSVYFLASAVTSWILRWLPGNLTMTPTKLLYPAKKHHVIDTLRFLYGLNIQDY